MLPAAPPLPAWMLPVSAEVAQAAVPPVPLPGSADDDDDDDDDDADDVGAAVAEGADGAAVTVFVVVADVVAVSPDEHPARSPTAAKPAATRRTGRA